MSARAVRSLAVVSTIVVVVALVIPIIPFQLSINIPFNSKPGSQICNSFVGGSAAYMQCQKKFMYPLVNITERASLIYALFHIGFQPFRQEYLVTQGNQSALYYTDGGNVTAAVLLGAKIDERNPNGVVAIENSSITRLPTGSLNASVTVKNIGSAPLAREFVYFRFPLVDSNFTCDGYICTFPGPTFCRGSLSPGGTCTSSILAPSSLTNGGKPVYYTVDIVGIVAAKSFLYESTIQGVYPQYKIDGSWVRAFIMDVNSARNGFNLTEDSTLDTFAQLRFNTSARNYGVSNYGLNSDYILFFRGSSRSVGETILYPGILTPDLYSLDLQQSAPGHWSVLVDKNYSKFGYYVATAPYVLGTEPCSVTEIPGPNINVTDYLTAHGCQHTIQTVTWLLIEVSS